VIAETTGRLLRIQSTGPEGVVLNMAKPIMPAIAANASPKKKPRTRPSRVTNTVFIWNLLFAAQLSFFDASRGCGFTRPP
jgi:hypothetical protein